MINTELAVFRGLPAADYFLDHKAATFIRHLRAIISI